MASSSNKKERSAQYILSRLDRWKDRLEGHHTHKREHERVDYRAKMTLHSPFCELGKESQIETEYAVWSRNISTHGVGFISDQRLPTRAFIICLDPEKESKLWFYMEVVRERQVDDNFWEYGAHLTERVSF